jgi:hypothetical protein
MTLEELIAQFRVDSDDAVAPYLASDTSVTAWLNEAEAEAAIRARLINDFSTPAVCQIAITAPTTVYTLHPSILDITRAAFTPTGSTTEYDVSIVDRVDQDRNRPGWRTTTDIPQQAIQSDTQLQLGCIPSTSGVLALEVNRLPIVNIEDSSAESPSIGAVHHRHLVQWAIHKHFARPDADIHDTGRSDKALAEFTRVFGIRPDADYRRATQVNRQPHNIAYW